MQSILTRIAEQETLTREEAERAMNLILTDSVSNEQIAAFLLGLRARGETLDELIGFTSVMRSHAVSVELPDHLPDDGPHENPPAGESASHKALDIVGTGGDGFGTFNISTAATFVCAGAGALVAKHGNRSVSSKCGSSDVLEELGVKTVLGKKGVEFCLREVGLTFIFAPLFHPAMKYVMPVRRELAVRTCFNILGPLCNPASVRHQLVGAFTIELAETMIQILAALGASKILAVHSDEGMDELSISGPSTVFTFSGSDNGDESGGGSVGGSRIESVGDSGGQIERETVTPSELGLEQYPIQDVIGGNATQNAEIISSVLNGSSGAPRNIVVLNAAFALLAGEMVTSASDGIELAKESIDSGRARKRLARLVEASNDAPAQA
ncbi:MAG: anthranilate phosphoribosyltransferase [Rhodothermia bacterium]|nr:MAG: anthranilate phosphoribosyltransferase [Rhodothermia bacterium]